MICGLRLAAFREPGTSRVVARDGRGWRYWYHREQGQSLKRTRCRQRLRRTSSGAYIWRCPEVQGNGLWCCVLLDFALLVWVRFLMILKHGNLDARLSGRSATTENYVFAATIIIIVPVFDMLSLFPAHLLGCIYLFLLRVCVVLASDCIKLYIASLKTSYSVCCHCYRIITGICVFDI